MLRAGLGKNEGTGIGDTDEPQRARGNATAIRSRQVVAPSVSGSADGVVLIDGKSPVHGIAEKTGSIMTIVVTRLWFRPNAKMRIRKSIDGISVVERLSTEELALEGHSKKERSSRRWHQAEQPRSTPYRGG